MGAFIAAALPLLQTAFELGVRYGPSIVALFNSAKNVVGGAAPTDADWKALHDLRDQIDAERHAREAAART